MARRRKSRSASARDVAEFARGKASASDKREMGFVKKSGRLVPGKRTPKRVRSAFTKRRIKPRKGQ